MSQGRQGKITSQNPRRPQERETRRQAEEEESLNSMKKSKQKEKIVYIDSYGRPCVPHPAYGPIAYFNPEPPKPVKPTLESLKATCDQLEHQLNRELNQLKERVSKLDKGPSLAKLHGEDGRHYGFFERKDYHDYKCWIQINNDRIKRSTIRVFNDGSMLVQKTLGWTPAQSDGTASSYVTKWWLGNCYAGKNI